MVSIDNYLVVGRIGSADSSVTFSLLSSFSKIFSQLHKWHNKQLMNHKVAASSLTFTYITKLTFTITVDVTLQLKSFIRYHLPQISSRNGLIISSSLSISGTLITSPGDAINSKFLMKLGKFFPNPTPIIRLAFRFNNPAVTVAFTRSPSGFPSVNTTTTFGTPGRSPLRPLNS